MRSYSSGEETNRPHGLWKEENAGGKNMLATPPASKRRENVIVPIPPFLSSHTIRI